MLRKEGYTMKNKALFLDKDGVINKLHYNTELGIIHTPLKPSEVEFVHGTFELLKKAKALGYLIIIISNQPNIGIKKMSITGFRLLKKHLNKELRKNGIKIDGEYYCLHHPFADIKSYKKNCSCRKPNTLLYEKAIKKFNIDPKKSWAVGDGIFDIIAGNNIGAKTILLANINEASYIEELEKKLSHSKPDYVVKGLSEVTSIIG